MRIFLAKLPALSQHVTFPFWEIYCPYSVILSLSHCLDSVIGLSWLVKTTVWTVYSIFGRLSGLSPGCPKDCPHCQPHCPGLSETVKSTVLDSLFQFWTTVWAVSGLSRGLSPLSASLSQTVRDSQIHCPRLSRTVY
jgi:hypothetical protein